MLKLSLSYFLILVSCCCWGQKQSANWYFGMNAGVNFTTGIPLALTNGQLQQDEGSATISDANGSLLFYTDGKLVYNAIHQQMPNGAGLLGSSSSTQSAIIVPQPGSATRYYIITTAAQGNSDGLNYSVVDLSLQGGLGDVVATEKNIHLDGFVAEKITAVSHANHQDIWVVSHRLDSNEFISYLITASGITTTPVVSATGIVYTAAMPNGAGALGYLKASPDGKKIASAVTYVSSGLQLFDFDNSSGQVANPFTLNNYFCYGLEFSPDSKMLYCTVTTAIAGKIFQYDISSGILATIQASQQLIAPEIKYAGLQLAMDGRIYAAQPGTTSLGVISNPNVAGNGCNFTSDAVSLAGRECRLGLPPFIQSFFQYNIDVDALCAGSVSKMQILSYTPTTGVQWNFGDPSSGAANISQELTPEHTYDVPGTYTITATVLTPTGESVTVTENIIIAQGAQAIFPGDVALCDDSVNDGRTNIDLSLYSSTILGTQDPQSYSLRYYTNPADADAQTNPILTSNYSNTVNPQTLYGVVANTTTGCKAMTSFVITVHPAPQPLSNVPDLHTCETASGGEKGHATFNLKDNEQLLLNGQAGMIVSYFDSAEAANLGTDPISNPLAYTNAHANAQAIYVRVTDPVSGCFTIVHFTIVVDPLPVSALENAAICIDITTGLPTPLVLDTGLQSGYSFAWTKDGKNLSAATGAITVDAPGNYGVVITDLATGCQSSDQAVVVISSGAVATAEIRNDFDYTQTITVTVTGGSGSYEYQLEDSNFQDEPYFTGFYEGEYTVRVRDKNGCQQLELTVIALNYPRFFSPNHDGTHDHWNIRGLYSQNDVDIVIFDRYGKVLTVITPQGIGWDGKFNGIDLPATDYWFSLNYHTRDGGTREFKSHFSLLR